MTGPDPRSPNQTDPDLVLASLRELVDITVHGDPGGTARVARFAELFGELDRWLAEGGTLPSNWHLSTCMSHDCRFEEAITDGP